MAAPNTKSKRAFAADARDAQYRTPQRPVVAQRMGTGIVTVDKVLKYPSDIPSAQVRSPQDTRPMHKRTPSGRHPLDPKLSGKLVPSNIPARTSKVTEKLVLLPDPQDVDEEKAAFDEEDADAPPTDDELSKRRSKGSFGKSDAERLSKSQRADKLARVTAYCTASAFRLEATADFLKEQHNARTKLYDDCLYAVYHLPLLGGNDGYRVRSSPALKSPGGKHVVDEEIERNELHEYQQGYFGDDEYGLHGHESGSPSPRSEFRRSLSPTPSPRRHSDDNRSLSPHRISPDAMSFAEMFIFGYGVVVFWNLTERQEKDILADMTFSVSETSIPLTTKPQAAESFETEELHFEYNPEIARPRIYNDMITLRSGDHMIKLAMSHAIAQSTKLSFFEERMQDTMQSAVSIPKRLALTGRLGMKREEVVKIQGRLFGSRVDVNLSSNILDVPEFFWDTEPTLHPLYSGVREYLEIEQRTKVLDERCKVFLELSTILTDSIADRKMTSITWIIIVLIVISILVTCSEVFLRFGLLTDEKKRRDDEVVRPALSQQLGTRSVGVAGVAASAFMPATMLGGIARMSMTFAWGLLVARWVK